MSHARLSWARKSGGRGRLDCVTCMAIGILPSGESLACDHEQVPHAGVMHFDAVRGVWWGETDDGVVILDPEIPG